jgi:hypothetical protein
MTWIKSRSERRTVLKKERVSYRDLCLRRGSFLGSVEIFFRRFEAPLCAIPAPVGAGAHTIPQYYREILIWVIQHSRDWGAPAAGQSPWSVIRKEVFYRTFSGVFMNFIPSVCRIRTCGLQGVRHFCFQPISSNSALFTSLTAVFRRGVSRMAEFHSSSYHPAESRREESRSSLFLMAGYRNGCQTD